MDIAKFIDHTLLKPQATKKQVIKCCREATTYHFASVCIQPCYVKLAAEHLKDSDVKVCTVIGFPLGANTSAVKAFEAKEAVENGADEVDMVINVGALKDGDLAYVENDIRLVVEAAQGAVVKVIIEACYLNDNEKEIACKLAQRAGAHFVKTSTGFGTGGATKEDVALMKRAVGGTMKVKAAGGIRSMEDTMAMIKAGADRIGASAGINILKESGVNTAKEE